MLTFNHFDKAYCIHYPSSGRQETIEAEFAKVGIQPEYVFAARPHISFHVTNMRRNPRIEFACGMSHIKAVVHSFGDERPIFFEDDVVFAADWQKILSKIEALPIDWDILYLGGHPRSQVEPHSDGLYKVGTFSCAEAYAFNNGAQERFFDFWCDRIGKPNAMYDFILGEFAEENNGYALYPTITHQPPGYSFIAEDKDNKTELIERGWLNNI